ncbi:MAG: DinB family protein [Saprospiraceae bacterium]|nr:DinB family protein [Saprospiraceae bacterium]
MEATPTTKQSIFEGLEESFQIVDQSLSELKPGECQLAFDGKWNASEQLEHLFLSNAAILKAIHLPKDQLRHMFGEMDHEGQNFNDLKARYLQVLREQGIKAPLRFQPRPETKKTLEEALAEWKKLGERFQEAASRWGEEELDRYVIPHPALGNLSVREMLFSAIFHNAHHLLQIEEIKSELITQ